MQEATAATDGGSLLRIQLTPGADNDAFPSGYNPWRERIEARVKAPARGGEANQALIDLAATVLSINPNRVEITQGHTSRKKTLKLHGLPRSALIEALSEVLD